VQGRGAVSGDGEGMIGVLSVGAPACGGSEAAKSFA
jgi:hypothetical protein